MLNLERHREIAIRFRAQGPLLTRPLVIGLLVALLLHLLLFLFFELGHYTIQEEQILTPTQVVIDLGALVMADQPADGGLLARYVAPPTSPGPLLPSSLPQTLERSAPLEAELPPSEQLFSKMRHHRTRRRASALLVRKRYYPATVSLSGPLATQTVIEDGRGELGKRRVNQTATARHTILFDVQLEEKSGSLYWIEQRTSTGHPTLDSKGRKIVHRLRFAPNPCGLIRSGQVEVAFEVEAGDPAGLLEKPPEAAPAH